MAGAFLILLREGFEAALVVGIILAVLARLDRRRDFVWVFWGIGAAALASVAFAVSADRISNLFDGAGQEVLNGVVLAAASAMITYVMVWLRGTRGRMEAHLSEEIHRRADGHGAGVFALAFLAVFREGAESVLFLWGVAAAGGERGPAIVLGAALGLAAAVLIAWALFQGGRRVPMRAFFSATTALLVVLAAGMLARAVGNWVAVDWLPALAYGVWDTSAVLPEGGPVGTVLAVLIGYNANPTLMEVLAYAAYLAGVGLWLALGRRGAAGGAPAPKGV
jgi:high-affinity iron transporter